jgi:hypothetical protein
MNVGFVLLGIWLILHGLAALIPQLGASPMNIVLAVIAIVAGILILVGR